jgi:hypothetical protein
MVHTELQSIANPVPSSSSTVLEPGFSSTPQHPSFARMEPVSPQTATRLLSELAPEMESLIVETNVKQGAGPLKTAWEVAVGRAYKRVMEEQQRRQQEEIEQEREVLRSHSLSRETTPTPSTPSRAGLPPQTTPTPASSTSASASFVKVKLEEDEGFMSLTESGYSMISSSATPSKPKLESLDNQPLPSTPSVPAAIPRSLYKSIPRTPGELPSPRPSPSPPPGSPSLKGKKKAGFASMTPFPPIAGGGGGYFAKGTAQGEGSEEMLEQYERMRARSLSC